MAQPTKLEKAKAQLVLDHPFFASLLLKYPIKARTDIPTLAVDKRGQIYYNEKFVESLTVPQIVWGLCHEIGHKIGNHALRMGTRNHKKWNIAGDAWINDMLTDAKVGEVIPGCVNMPGSKDETIEAIYDKLPDDPNGGNGVGKPGQGGGNGPCEPGDPADGLGDDLLDEGAPVSESEAKAMEAQMKVDMVQAAQAAKMRGKLPGSIARMVDEIINVKTPWYDKLERFMVDKVKNDSTWNRPNRRYIGQDIYLPSLDSIGAMGVMVLGVDTSGSIGQKELDYFGGHLNRILEDCRPSKIYVVYCDAVVNHVDEYCAEDLPVRLTPHGGGGTDMREIFNYVDEHGLAPVCTVVLTDGYTPFPSSVDSPTIWAITTDVVAPAEAGETLAIDPDA